MNINARVTAALWIGLALAGGANPSLAAPSDPVRGHDGGAMDSVTGNTDVPAVPRAEPQFRPDFSGHWTLNAEASDDPREKMKEAMQAMKQAKGGGRGMGGGSGGQGRGGGKGGGRQGRGSSGGMGGRSEMPSGELSALIATTEKLNITHEDPMLLIADENDQRQRIFTDFRGASVSASGGLQQRVVVAGWEGASLVVETTTNNGARLVQNFQINAKTGQLLISAATQLPGMQPVSYRLVYDRLKPETDAGNRRAGRGYGMNDSIKTGETR